MSHHAQKLFVKNRKGENVSVLIEKSENQKGLAFVMHGLGGFKEQVHIAAFAEVFKEKEFTVIRFDTTNTFGESDGNYENATVTNYYEDLENVIAWSKTQSWYQEPFWLTGHSLGGMCTTLYAQKNPKRVYALAPISTVVSGNLSSKTYSQEEINQWKTTGWLEKPSISLPGVIKKLKWAHMEDRLTYDLLTDANTLTMPVFLLTGEQDETTPPEHQHMLFNQVPGPKEIHVIKGAPHTFREEKHLNEIKKIMTQWINKHL